MNTDVQDELLNWVRGHYFGKYRGLVVSNQDPTRRGRILVIIPAVLGDTQVWAMPCVPFAGAGVGLHVLPEPDTGVWIEFEAGDPSFPVWTGCFWSDSQLPEDQVRSEATPDVRMLRSREGMMVVLDDSKRTISVSDQSGANILKLSIDDGLVTLQAVAKVVVEAPQIDLVQGATHPIVHGDDLVAYIHQLVQIFNAHMHPGELALGIPITPMTPLPLFPPPTPALLSTRVRNG